MSLTILNKFFDIAKDYVLKYSRNILNQKPEKIVSPIPEDYLEKVIKEKRQKQTQPSSVLSSVSAVSSSSKTPQKWNEVYSLVSKYFGKEADNMMEVLKGENRGLNPRAENVNKDGSIDRGLFQINSNTFADFMRRKKDRLYKMGIRSFEDMYDPEKNVKMARIIWEEQGYNAWYGAPSYLRK